MISGWPFGWWNGKRSKAKKSKTLKWPSNALMLTTANIFKLAQKKRKRDIHPRDSTTNWQKMARNREQWKNLMEAYLRYGEQQGLTTTYIYTVCKEQTRTICDVFCNILLLCLIDSAMPLVCVVLFFSSFLSILRVARSNSTGPRRLCIVDDNKSSSQSNRIKSNAIHSWPHPHSQMHTSSRSRNENDLINLIENFDDPKLSGGVGGRQRHLQHWW